MPRLAEPSTNSGRCMRLPFSVLAQAMTLCSKVANDAFALESVSESNGYHGALLNLFPD